MRGAGQTGRGNHSLIPHPEPENEASTAERSRFPVPGPLRRQAKDPLIYFE